MQARRLWYDLDADERHQADKGIATFGQYNPPGGRQDNGVDISAIRVA